jgi:hypothetical protein
MTDYTIIAAFVGIVGTAISARKYNKSKERTLAIALFHELGMIQNTLGNWIQEFFEPLEKSIIQRQTMQNTILDLQNALNRQFSKEEMEEYRSLLRALEEDRKNLAKKEALLNNPICKIDNALRLVLNETYMTGPQFYSHEAKISIPNTSLFFLWKYNIALSTLFVLLNEKLELISKYINERNAILKDIQLNESPTSQIRENKQQMLAFFNEKLSEDVKNAFAVAMIFQNVLERDCNLIKENVEKVTRKNVSYGELPADFKYLEEKRGRTFFGKVKFVLMDWIL